MISYAPNEAAKIKNGVWDDERGILERIKKILSNGNKFTLQYFLS